MKLYMLKADESLTCGFEEAPGWIIVRCGAKAVAKTSGRGPKGLCSEHASYVWGNTQCGIVATNGKELVGYAAKRQADEWGKEGALCRD